MSDKWNKRKTYQIPLGVVYFISGAVVALIATKMQSSFPTCSVELLERESPVALQTSRGQSNVMGNVGSLPPGQTESPLWASVAMKSVAPRLGKKCQEILDKKRGFSQVQADTIAYHTFFLNRTTPGVYLEIGAYHPSKLSNSAFFDICLGWHGICVEPDPTKVEVWSKAKERSCNWFRKCLLDADDTVCMGDLNDGTTKVQKTGVVDKKCGPEEAAVECTTFEKMLENFPAKSRLGEPKSLAAEKKVQIDFVSLDVESNEMKVLRCFPFDRYDISMFLIETASNPKLYDWFMMNKGYLKWDELRNGPYPTDTLYVRRDLLYSGGYVDPKSIQYRGRNIPDRFNGKEKELRCPN